MEIIRSEIIPEVIKIKPTIYCDSRGNFVETYSQQLIGAYEFTCREFVQDNVSYSKQNVLRGLHYQIGDVSQGKLITCLSGIIFDVAVDLRLESKTFGKWTAFTLRGEDREQVWIPEGFAHGFYTVMDGATIMYKTTNFYAPDAERTLIWNDPDVNVQWNWQDNVHPLLSEKDSKGKMLKELVDELL
jgi:dTDP-4-dehydrorhamnose 3,5-epimerase